MTRARGRRALRHHHPDAPTPSSDSGFDTMIARTRGRQALLLRGRAAGRDPVHAREAPARLRLHARAHRQGRLLRQRAEVQGAPVDHGDLLDEELHRDPGRPAPPHRPRPPAEREDRRPSVHHPAAVHRHRRHHRRRGAHAHAHAVRPEAHHHGQQPGRVRRGVLRHHRRRPARRSTTSASRPSAASARWTLEDRDHRRRHARARRRSARRASRSASSASRSTSRARTSPPTPARRPRPSTPTTAGAAARAPSKRPSRSCACTTTSATRRCRGMHVVFGAYEGPIDAKPGEKVVFIGDCAKWKGKLGDELVQIESLYKDRSTKDPHHAEARRHLRQDAKRAPRSSRPAARTQYVRLEGCPVSVAEQVLALVSLGKAKNPYLEPSEAVRFNKAYLSWQAAMAVRRHEGPEVPEGRARARAVRPRRGSRPPHASRQPRGSTPRRRLMPPTRSERGAGRAACKEDRARFPPRPSCSRHGPCCRKKSSPKPPPSPAGLAIDAVHASQSGHLGLPLGCAEIGAVLFGHALAPLTRRTPSGSTATASCSRPATARCSSTRGCTSAATAR